MRTKKRVMRHFFRFKKRPKALWPKSFGKRKRPKRLGFAKGNRPKPAKAAKRRHFRGMLFALFSLVVLSGAFFLSNVDSRILPPVLEIIDMTARNYINASIDQSLQTVTEQNTLQASDFYSKTLDESGMVNALSVNTVLVNNLCARLATDISARLEAIGSQTVQIPVAAIFNWRAFANVGPSFPITVLPVGNAVVDYETVFESVGINQVNFQLWLKVDSSVQVVNPIQNQEITVSRKLALVNTVFSGRVPETYLHNTPVAVPVG